MLALIALPQGARAFRWAECPSHFIMALGPDRRNDCSVVLDVRGATSDLGALAERHLILCSAKTLADASLPVIGGDRGEWILQSGTIRDMDIRAEVDRFITRATDRDADLGSRRELQIRGSLLIAMVAEQALTSLEPSDDDGDRLKRVVAFIDAHLSEPIKVDDLAKVSGVSVRRLYRLFSERFDLSPAAYLLRRRLDVARSLLESGEGGLAEIGFATGFSSQAHFTTAFRSRWGTTPGRFQRAAVGQYSVLEREVSQ